MYAKVMKMLQELHRAESAVDREINDAIAGSNWDEDYITRRILLALKKSSQNMAAMNGSSIKLNWCAYKQTGNVETQYGDIGFVVNITFPNKKMLRGIAFLEAKRIYPEADEFTKLGSWTQIERMLKNTQHHHLLLYDQKPQRMGFLQFPHLIFADLPCTTRVIVIPSQHAVTARVKGREIFKYGHSFIEQVYGRYFKGLDLDFQLASDDDNLRKVIKSLQFVALAAVDLGAEDAEPSIEPIKALLSDQFEEIISAGGDAT
jgi:hypothetical protein